MPYFDAVLTKDRFVMFNGTPEETLRWIKSTDKEQLMHLEVCEGETLQFISIEDYVKKGKARGKDQT